MIGPAGLWRCVLREREAGGGGARAHLLLLHLVRCPPPAPPPAGPGARVGNGTRSAPRALQHPAQVGIAGRTSFRPPPAAAPNLLRKRKNPKGSWSPSPSPTTLPAPEPVVGPTASHHSTRGLISSKVWLRRAGSSRPDLFSKDAAELLLEFLQVLGIGPLHSALTHEGLCLLLVHFLERSTSGTSRRL